MKSVHLTNDGLTPVMIYVRMPVRSRAILSPRDVGSVFIFRAIIVHAFSSFHARSASGENLIRINRRGTFQPCAIDVAGVPLSRIEIRVISRPGSLRSRRMDRWPPVPARTNDRLVLDTGSISWFICGTQGCHLLSRVEPTRPKSVFPPPSRKSTETRGVESAGGWTGEGGGVWGSVQGLHENLYTEREGVVYTAVGRVDLIRWWFFNETSCARHLRDPAVIYGTDPTRGERTKERSAW